MIDDIVCSGKVIIIPEIHGGVDMERAVLTKSGQATIPKIVRDRLGLKPGDRIDFVTLPNGTVLLVPVNLQVDDLAGLLHSEGHVATVEEINRAVEEEAASL